jgi:hypothetical protein
METSYDHCNRSRFEVIAATRSVKELKGMFGKPTKRVSIEDMNKAIAYKYFISPRR